MSGGRSSSGCRRAHRSTTARSSAFSRRHLLPFLPAFPCPSKTAFALASPTCFGESADAPRGDGASLACTGRSALSVAAACAVPVEVSGCRTAAPRRDASTSTAGGRTRWPDSRAEWSLAIVSCSRSSRRRPACMPRAFRMWVLRVLRRLSGRVGRSTTPGNRLVCLKSPRRPVRRGAADQGTSGCEGWAGGGSGALSIGRRARSAGGGHPY